MSAVRHVFAVNRPCVRCMTSGGDIVRSKMAGGRSLREIKMAGKRLLKITRNNIASVGDENRATENKD